MPRIFAYIVHKAGVADDSALELLAAARKTRRRRIARPRWSPAQAPNSTQSANRLRSSYAEVWKIANETLAYPNAELVRKALVKILPPGSIVLVPHDHFGIDLAPGLSIKLNAAFVSDVVDIEGAGQAQPESRPPGIRRTGQRPRRCDISSGAVITVRPGAFKPPESAAVERAGGR